MNDHPQSEWRQEVENDEKAAPNPHIQMLQTMNRALESVGMKSFHITDIDRLEGAMIEAQLLCYDGKLEQAKRVLREALKEQGE